MTLPPRLRIVLPKPDMKEDVASGSSSHHKSRIEEHFPDPWADPKSRSPLGLHHLYHSEYQGPELGDLLFGSSQGCEFRDSAASMTEAQNCKICQESIENFRQLATKAFNLQRTQQGTHKEVSTRQRRYIPSPQPQNTRQQCVVCIQSGDSNARPDEKAGPIWESSLTLIRCLFWGMPIGANHKVESKDAVAVWASVRIPIPQRRTG